MTPVSHGKPCAGNPHARFDEGASASEEPRRNALLHISEDSRTKSMLSDISWITTVVDECVPISKARAALKKDLKWYIEEREKKGPDNTEYAQQYGDQSNSAVINRIREFLENQKYHPTEKQQQYYPDKIKAYQEVDIERVVQWLRDRFEG